MPEIDREDIAAWFDVPPELLETSMPRSAIGVRYVGGPRDGDFERRPGPLPYMIVVEVMPEISAAAIWDDMSPFLEPERVQYYPIRAPYGDSVWLYVSGDVYQDLVRGVFRDPERFDPDVRAALATQARMYRLLRDETIPSVIRDTASPQRDAHQSWGRTLDQRVSSGDPSRAEDLSVTPWQNPAECSGKVAYPWDAIARETDLIARIDELTRDGQADPACG